MHRQFGDSGADRRSVAGANLRSPIPRPGQPALGDDGTLLNNCYCILELDGPTIQTSYYQVPGGQETLHSETIQ